MAAEDQQSLRESHLFLAVLSPNYRGEAEPLMQRAVEIFLQFIVATRHDHPSFQTAIENYKGLLKEMGRSQQEIQAKLNAVGRCFGIRFGRGA